MKNILLLVLCLYCVSMPLTSRGEVFDQQSNLKGFTSVYVCIEHITEEAKQDARSQGLTDEQIQIDTELSLRQSGIKVITAAEYAKDVHSCMLYINPSISINTKSSLCFFSIDTNVQNTVYLTNAKKYTSVIVWETGTYGTRSDSDLAPIRDVIKDEVNKFCNDYLAANPKTAEPDI